MVWSIDNNKGTYILRYYLPALPKADENETEIRSTELIDFCIKNDVGAVMLYVDLNPYWCYMPDTLEHTKYLIGVLKKTIERLRENNISYQLNYQNLFGSWDGGADHREMMENWECYHDEFGRASLGVGCMSGEKFQKLALEKLSLWAQTKPDAIWIDDDIRLHNHRTGIYDLWNEKSGSEGLDFGCFCDEHINKFNQKYKTNLTREEIVTECLKKGKPSKIRKMWLDFNSETPSDFALKIEKCVNCVSPDTRVAIMTSGPDEHSVEGRNWNTLLSNLSGDKTPLLRPTFGPYRDGDIKDYVYSYLCIEQAKENIKSQYKKEFDFCPEIENTRFTRYSKSLSATSFQLKLSAFLGCHGVTLSIFDLDGCILSEESEFGTLLKENKRFCDALAKYNLFDKKSSGISFITAPDRISDINLDDDATRLSDFIKPRTFEKTLTTLGIPVNYITPDNINTSKAFVLTNYTAKLLADEELLMCLSKGVLLDLGAALEIEKRGFGKHLGIKTKEKMMCMSSSERFTKLKRTDGSFVTIPSRIRGDKWRKIELCGADALSYQVSPLGDEQPGFTKFNNSLGGTVYIYNAMDDYGEAFCSNYRVEFIKDIIDDITSGCVRVNTPSYALTSAKEDKNKIFIHIANLSFDDFENLKISIPFDIKKSYLLKDDGILSEIENRKKYVEINRCIKPLDSITLILEK